ncbi:hypothetical protein [Ornithinimicrobium kibberense]
MLRLRFFAAGQLRAAATMLGGSFTEEGSRNEPRPADRRGVRGLRLSA